MSTIRYTVKVETMGPLVDPLVSQEIDGITYRAEIVRADSRSCSARLLDPFEQTLDQESPLFILAMTGRRFVRDGKPTDHLWQAIRSRMAWIHRVARLKTDLETAMAVSDGCLADSAAEVQARVQSLTREVERLEWQLRPLRQALSDKVTAFRRSIQKSVPKGLFGHAESVRLLQDHEWVTDTALAHSGDMVKGSRDLQASIEALQQQVRQVGDDFETASGFRLADVLNHLKR